MSFQDYERPAVTADIVLFRIKNKQLQVALVKRETQEVEQGKWSLPGGFVDIDKTLCETLHGKIAEKLGFDDFTARQFTIKDNIARDDRWRVISCVYLGTAKAEGNCKWFTVEGETLHSSDEEMPLSALAFDHSSMVREAIHLLRRELFTCDEIFDLTGETFTLPELKNTCEAITGHKIDNFTRRIKDMVEPTGEMLRGKRCRPAQYYVRRRSQND